MQTEMEDMLPPKLTKNLIKNVVLMIDYVFKAFVQIRKFRYVLLELNNLNTFSERKNDNIIFVV